MNSIQNDDDLFFRPKDVSKRDDEIKSKRRDAIRKIKLGLKNIEKDSENENWESKEERLFLQIFSNFHLSKIYNKRHCEYCFKNENNNVTAYFDLKCNYFYVSNDHVWVLFEEMYLLDDQEIHSFLERMIRKYFEMCNFVILNGIVLWQCH